MILKWQILNILCCCKCGSIKNETNKKEKIDFKPKLFPKIKKYAKNIQEQPRWSKTDLEALEKFNSLESLNKSDITQNNYNKPTNAESNNFISNKINLKDHVTMYMKPLPQLYPLSREIHHANNYNRNSLNIVTDQEYIRLNKTDSMINDVCQKDIQFNSKNSYLLYSAKCSKSALILPLDQVAEKNELNDMPDNLIKYMKAVTLIEKIFHFSNIIIYMKNRFWKSPHPKNL